MNKFKHLTFDDRKTIQAALHDHLSKAYIAKLLGKDPSTIAKEIRLHRVEKKNRSNFFYSDCSLLKQCKHCDHYCSRYTPSSCLRRDRSPGACNGCSKVGPCHLTHYFYYADIAQKEYLDTLSDSRSGINFTTSEWLSVCDIVVPLLLKRQSPYQIITSHPELGFTEKSLYNYIEWGYFSSYGITDINLKRKVKYHVKKDKRLKKRKDNSHYLGRTYSDYLAFIESNNLVDAPQMDTVYNDISNGPFIQTFLFPQCNLIFAVLHEHKDAESMVKGFLRIRDLLGDDFSPLFPALLTDRGSEFSDTQGFEKDPSTGEIMTHLFYCDPMRSSQKPQIEKTHSDLREILPKNLDLSFLTQDKLDLACSHVNSKPRESLHGKTSYELFEFLYHKKILDKLNIQKISKDDVTLHHSLVE